jgi:hypothetical protein
MRSLAVLCVVTAHKVHIRFFAGPLSRFNQTVDTPVGPSGRKFVRLHKVAVLDSIGEGECNILTCKLWPSNWLQL